MHGFIILIIWLSRIYITISQTPWIMGNESLPRASDAMAVGSYNGTIFLIGGYNEKGNNKQLVEVDIDTQNVTDLGKTFLPLETSCEGQSWTQHAHLVYTIDGTGSFFNTFNLITKSYTTTALTFPINVGGGGSACLASSDTFLYVVGGAYQLDPINTVQILSLSTNSWVNDPPPMQVQRHQHACLVHNNYLWGFGGAELDRYGTEHATSERILTTQITQNTWDFIDSFNVSLYGIRAAAWNDIIYIIGGIVGTIDHHWMRLVDANTGTIIMPNDALPFSNSWGSPIIVDGLLYVFGGYFDESKDDFSPEWFYYTLTPFIATQIPSNDPTTSNPSSLPSAIPSRNPSNLPTIMVTTDPTNNPLRTASNKPSHNPSSNVPTSNPTVFPSAIPSRNPSLSNLPTNNPLRAANSSNDPSHNPSSAPVTSHVTVSSHKPTRETDDRVVENPGSSMAPVTTRHTSYGSENDFLFTVAIICAVSVLVILLVSAMCCLKRKKKLIQQVFYKVSMEMHNVETSNPTSFPSAIRSDKPTRERDNETQDQKQSGTCERYPSHHGDIQTNDHQMNPPKVKYVFDDHQDKEIIVVNGKATAGEALEGLDAEIADDEFEVVGNDEYNHNNAPEGGQTTVER
eukprot:7479_1